MDIARQSEYWLHTAEHDLDTAEALFAAEKYDWCLFLGHLVLEKALKAHWTKANQSIPPKTHNLVLLAEKANVDLSEEDRAFLQRVNEFNIETRYPEEKLEFYKVCTKDFAQENFAKIKELYQWLVSRIEK